MTNCTVRTGRRRRLRHCASLGIAAALALAAGCSSASPGSGSSGSHQVHLTYALWDPVQEVGYKKSIALFEKSHPSISVSVEQIAYPDYEGLPAGADRPAFARRRHLRVAQGLGHRGHLL